MTCEALRPPSQDPAPQAAPGSTAARQPTAAEKSARASRRAQERAYGHHKARNGHRKVQPATENTHLKSIILAALLVTTATFVSAQVTSTIQNTYCYTGQVECDIEVYQNLVDPAGSILIVFFTGTPAH